MPVVWFLNSAGRRFHIPVVGAVDINTPDTAIPVGMVTAIGNCNSGTRVVVHPTFGTFTINFDPPGRTGGPCAQCGSCCTHPVDQCNNPARCGYVLDATYNVHRCQHLVIDPRPNSLGRAGRCSCAIHADLMNTYKGCTLGPDRIDPWMTACTFAFPG